MTPGCSMARSPRPVVPPPCSSTGGRDRMAGFADIMAPGMSCIASRAMGVTRDDRPTDNGDGDLSIEPVATVEPLQGVEPLSLALGGHDRVAQRGVRPVRMIDVIA